MALSSRVRERCLAAAVLALAACGSGGGAGDADSASTTVEVTTPEAVTDLPVVPCCAAQGLDAGAYALPSTFAPFTAIEVAEGWGILNEPAARLLAFVQGDNGFGSPSRLLALYRAEPADAEPLLESLATAPELVVLDRAAERIDLLARPNAGFEGAPGADIAPGTHALPALDALATDAFGVRTSTPEARLRVVLRTEGDLLLVAVVEAPQAEFDAFAAEADELLASLRSP